MSRQIRVSEACAQYITDLSSQYGVDKKTLLNVAILLMKNVMEYNAESIQIVDENEKEHTIIVPLVYNKKKGK